jgi:hypothetical protein
VIGQPDIKRNCVLALSRHSFPGLAWHDVWRRSEIARIPTVMTFGKHKGAALKDIPGDYEQWLLKQPDVGQYLVKALRGEAAWSNTSACPRPPTVK